MSFVRIYTYSSTDQVAVSPQFVHLIIPMHQPALLYHTTANNRGGWRLPPRHMTPTAFFSNCCSCSATAYTLGRECRLPSSAYMGSQIGWYHCDWQGRAYAIPPTHTEWPVFLPWIPLLRSELAISCKHFSAALTLIKRLTLALPLVFRKKKVPQGFLG